ncbi:MAG: hypothetical protein ABI564_03795 [Ideonella sp.]
MTGRLPFGVATICVLLQACAGVPAPPLTAPEPGFVEAAPIVVLPPEPTAYEIGQRARALDLERQGKLAEAVLIWEVLTTIRPRHDDYREHWLEAKRRAAAAAADRVQRGDQAAARGQFDTAASNYLAALALQPDQPKAAEALRTIEKERVRRTSLGKLSRLTLTRRSMADAEMSPPGVPSSPGASRSAASAAMAGARDGEKTAKATPPSVPQDRIEVEHASLLASQGEYDEAVAMLDAWLASNGRDEAARTLLADVLYQQADSIAASNPTSAIALLERSVQLNRKNSRASQKLKQLKSAAGQPARK